MLTHMKASELEALSGTDRQKALDGIVESSRSMNGQSTKFIEEKIHAFELRYEMTSCQLLDSLSEGKTRETAEIAEWLFWIDTLQADAR